MKNHKGFTIVELLIGMTILSIVAVALTGFIVSSSKSYAASNTEIIVQQESQLAMNQISDVIIDTTRSVNYVGYSPDGSVSEQVIKDAEFTIDVEDKCLVLYNGEGTVVVDASGNPVLDADGNPEIAKDASGNPIITGGNGNKNYQIYWDKSEEKLFYSEIDISETVFPESDRVLLAEYVKDFSVDLSQVEEKRVVKLTISYNYNNKVYETSNNITIRNKVLVNSINLAVNKSLDVHIRVKEKVVYLEPGETYHFSTPIIEGRNILDKSVTWSISTEEGKKPLGADTKFTDTSNGIIHIDNTENIKGKDVEYFQVIVTTNALDSAGNPFDSDTVDVYVKRAKEVTLSKSADSDANNGPLEISPGCTFTITANVSGTKLGTTCSECGDNVTIDKQVGHEGTAYPWLIHNPSAVPGATTQWDPNKYIKLIESAPDHATFYFGPDENGNMPTSNGDIEYDVVIQSASLLSVTDNTHGRHYDPVFGAIRLKMVKHKEANITAGGSLHWGASTEIKWDNLSSYHYYVICARIREYGTASGDKDKIMLYLSEGNTTRVTPDMFGVEDVSKPWYLSLQVLNPGKELPSGVALSTQLNVGAQVNDPTVLDIIDDYLNNCDSSGTYVGTKYLHSDKLEATINPPEIYYEYNGEKNLGGELKLKTASTIGGPAWTQFKVDYVRNTRDEVLGYEFANQNIKYSVYKETADGGLQKVYWYNSNGNYEGNAYPYDGLLQFGEINASNAIIKINSNNMARASEAAGKYQLIPTIIYEQDFGADHVGGSFLYYLNYKPNYKNKQCYEDKRSTVHFELVSGGNMTLMVYTNNNVRKGDVYFPLPSDMSQDGFSKYFDMDSLKDGQVHHSKEGIALKFYGENNNNSDVYFSEMTCEYIATKNVYKIELFYTFNDALFGRNIKVSAGSYTCAADGSRWEQASKGSLDEYYNKGEVRGYCNATIRLYINGNESPFGTYLPLPSDSDFGSTFGFDLNTIKTNGYQKTNSDTVKIKYKDGGSTPEASYKYAECWYDEKTKTYTLKVDCARDQNDFNKDGQHKVLTFTCQEGAMSWTSVY